MKAPILFLTFNRPDQTREVLSRIVLSNPGKVYVSADGPRQDHPEDAERCKMVREIVDEALRDIEIHKRFHDKNLGCKKSVASALKWFFEENENGIVLEDDTLPDMSFFRFCEAALVEFKDDERIMLVSGHNPLGSVKNNFDALFSKYPFIWGWASWKRAMIDYGEEIDRWSSEQSLRRIDSWLVSPHARFFWHKAFEDVRRGLDTWDYQLFYTMCQYQRLAVVSSKNLVENIGFGRDAIHTKDPNDARKSVPVYSAPEQMAFPVKPKSDPSFERTIIRKMFFSNEITMLGKLKRVIRPVLNAVFSR